MKIIFNQNNNCRYLILLSILAFTISVEQIFSQNMTSEQISNLQNFSKLKEIEYYSKRADAEFLAEQKQLPIFEVNKNGVVLELQYFSNGIPRYYITTNLNSAKTISSNEVWSGGTANLNLDGSGIRIGIWDGGGVLTSHSEFTNTGSSRVIQKDVVTTISDHATHVAGTMIAGGVEVNAKGMAFNAMLDAYDWNSDEAEIALAASGGLQLSNHSYGFITGWHFNSTSNRYEWYGDISVSDVEDHQFGLYTDGAKELDEIAFNAPFYLSVHSAGNDRNDLLIDTIYYVWNNGNWEERNSNIIAPPLPDGGINQINNGYDTMPGKKNAKNIMTIGSVADIPNGYSQSGDVSISSFSNWGPTDDGRIKPDIVANGESLYSSGVFIIFPTYNNKSGTSMSSPSVTGSLGLLLEQFKDYYPNKTFLSSTLKCLVLHSADEAGNNPGPDYVNGWGLMNTENAAKLISSSALNNLNIHELEIQSTETIEIDIDVPINTDELKITIVWTDPAGQTHPNILDPSNLILVNDLDIILQNVSDEEIYRPWKLNPENPSLAATTGDNDRDNVEQIMIQNPTSGTYKILINHEGQLTNGIQKFSLIVSGNSSFSEPKITVEKFVDMKIFLEGPFDNGEMMNNIANIPLSQPFGVLPWSYNGNESVNSIPNDIVDWILIELRDKNDSNIVRFSRAAFINKTGSIVDLDGISPVSFSNEPDDEYFIAVHHRNHLSVLSENKIILQNP